MAKVLRTSETPNPLALKFHLDCAILLRGSKNFPAAQSAASDILAQKLFQIPHVTSVFFVGSVVTINKEEQSNWDELIVPVADVIEEYAKPDEGTRPAAEGNSGAATNSRAQENQATMAKGDYNAEPGSEIGSGEAIEIPQDFFSLNKEDQFAHVNRIFDEMVRPGLAGDGGGLALLDIQDRVVKVNYQGACGSCPSSTEGTLSYIENALRQKAHPDLCVSVESEPSWPAVN